MDKIIQVEEGISDNEYDLMLEAVEAAKVKENLYKTKLDLINGKILKSYQFGGNALVLCFSDDLYAVILPDQNSIYLDVVFDNPKINNISAEQNIYLELSCGLKILWDWKNVLDSFVGKQVAISPSDQVLFIFYRGGDEYLITFYVEKDNPKKQFLTISEA